ncbi:MAG: hypothetical protein RBT41_11305, partial [Clostridia bacterium]|jgi:uncharacterized membrane protein|nr:hypothetical protein [Clostridia bacterium]
MLSLLQGNWNLPGATYLWMFPIYGLAVFLEPLHDRLSGAYWFIRGFIYLALIFATEYVTGWLLSQALGSCPWDYSYTTPYHMDGYIRMDYAPVWFIVGLLFERIHRFLDRIRL